MKRAIYLALAAGMILTVGMAQETRAQTETQFYRWGIGWDDGLGVRYLLTSRWGVGFQFNPDWDDRSTDEFRSTAPGEVYVPSRSGESDRRTITIGALVFHHVRIGHGFGFGPYARIAYSHENLDSWSNATGTRIPTEVTANAFVFEVGLRPTYALSERFVLESRFGIGVHRLDRNTATADGNGQRIRNEIDETEFFVFGEDLGPGAVVQFMVYF